MWIELEQIESTYRSKIQDLYADTKVLTVADLIDVSTKLFQEIKIAGISDNGYADKDMLLYQYGVYNWYDELGEYFSFDITRQCITAVEDEPYQLRFELVFNSEPFKDTGWYNCWSCDFTDIEDFNAHIKSTEGYATADKFMPKTYRLQFNQC